MAEPHIRGVGVVGLGIGTAHVRALRRLRDRFAVVAVCDPDESRSRPVAEHIGADVVPFDELVSGLRGLMLPDDRLEEELKNADQPPRDPFA